MRSRVLTVIALMLFGAALLHAADRLEVRAVSYEPGAVTLSPQEELRLERFFDRYLKNHPQGKVRIAAWSDRPFPKSGVERSEDEDLARQRLYGLSDKARKYVSDDALLQFNMARGSHVVAKLFGTEEAKLKELFSQSRLSVWDAQDKLRPFVELGGAGKAVIVLDLGPEPEAPLAH